MKTVGVSVGDNCVDHYLPPINHDFSGGNAANVAVYLQRSGCPTAYMGAIGADANGKLILQDLGREGVDTKNVKIFPDYPTACTHIRLTETNERQFVYEDLGPYKVFSLDETDITFIQHHRIVHNTWQGGTEEYLPLFKQATGLLVSLDYGERYTPDFIDRTIEHVDIAFFSLPEDDTQDIYDLARKMKARGPGLVVVTQGIKGSLALNEDFHFQPAYPVKVVDTLGAGDAYIGTFLANWLNHKGIAHCMQVAARIASQTCGHFGGW